MHAAGPLPVTATEPPRQPFARLERLAAGRSGVLLVGGWAFAEAIFFPIIPDVILGLLVLVAPRRLPVLFGALVLGALAGTAVLYAMTLAAPGAVDAMLVALPGIAPPMVDQARTLVADGAPASIALLGPGTPLKVYTYAWATGPATPIALAAAVVLNRITRILPTLLLLWAVGWVAPGFLRRHDRLVLVAYAAFYVAAYAVYWR
jgi:1-acyl-sn-glycerol-3-phosphate acyltransferase